MTWPQKRTWQGACTYSRGGVITRGRRDSGRR
ncbi:hypothetical protein E2C01_092600 [Portunus trituberculatus]|uniref:Uncharacterized protein n=1 Tax=Portunus trituberculatus TaxID=210409 RepID=A0A5B7JRU4_PORTR|nr:hypothetical protein [Portunus trituberculatus]